MSCAGVGRLACVGACAASITCTHHNNYSAAACRSSTLLHLPPHLPAPPSQVPTGGSDCKGVLLMSESRLDKPKPPSFRRPFSSSRMLEGFRSQYMMELWWRYCSKRTSQKRKCEDVGEL
eukprot:1160989-Pelagomonas_calceolata.AAC.18